MPDIQWRDLVTDKPPKPGWYLVYEPDKELSHYTQSHYKIHREMWLMHYAEGEMGFWGSPSVTHWAYLESPQGEQFT
jgi:hypothetical protein